MESKLVRDKIPEIIEESNKIPETHIANDQEYSKALLEKLKEESQEFAEEPNQEELADIYEVIDAIISSKNWSKKDIIKIQEIKANERGKFEKKIILDKVN
jgi:predicted house-cleaning noncanonical NTP pyrophosphatase (MazG superfamily)